MDMCGIIEFSRKAAYQAVNTALVQRNWLIGYRIAEEELQGEIRSEYGLKIIKKLSQELTERYGKGYDRSNLYHCLRFYKMFPEIVDAASRQFRKLLSWTHYRTLLQVNDKEARDWYEKEALEQTWSVKTLQRNISSQYYYRMLQTHRQDLVENEMKELTAGYQNDKYEFIKNPVIAEFLGFATNTDFTESDLEKSILSNLQKFLMELGKGYAFVGRQQQNLKIILCGSALSFMENKVLSEKSPLFGRRDSQIKLEAFQYLDVAKFVPGYSNEDKAICYGITGGVAKYLAMIDQAKSIDENIVRLFFRTDGISSGMNLSLRLPV